MKKAIQIVFVVALVSLMACKGGKAPADATKKVVDTEIQFDTVLCMVGDLYEDQIYNAHFVFYNRGDNPLLIDSVATTCHCTIPVYFKTPVAPGDSSQITVAIQGSALKPGYFSKSVMVYSNGSVEPVSLTLRGESKRGDASLPGDSASVKD